MLRKTLSRQHRLSLGAGSVVAGYGYMAFLLPMLISGYHIASPESGAYAKWRRYSHDGCRPLQSLPYLATYAGTFERTDFIASVCVAAITRWGKGAQSFWLYLGRILFISMISCGPNVSCYLDESALAGAVAARKSGYDDCPGRYVVSSVQH